MDWRKVNYVELLILEFIMSLLSNSQYSGPNPLHLYIMCLFQCKKWMVVLLMSSEFHIFLETLSSRDHQAVNYNINQCEVIKLYY